MNHDPDEDLIDEVRTACLCDVGAPGYLAATAVDPDGQTRFVIADLRRIDDDTARYDRHCRDVPHEQLGPLPLEYVKRLTISQRHHPKGTTR
jgi:hypothetical protein